MLRAALGACLAVGLAAQDPAIAVHEDVVYSDVARQPRRNSLDLVVPKAKTPPPLVMFTHGGSWTGGKKDGFRAIGTVLAKQGYACALINTQMFPFVKPDTMVRDCGRALGFLHRSADEYGFDGNQLFVMGHSSGAHLSSWLALDDELLKEAGVPKKALRGAILLSGVYDVRCRHFALDGVFGRNTEFRTQATPWLYADKDDVPIFIAWGNRDLPGLSLCARILRDRLTKLGVPVCAHEYDRNHQDYVFQIGSTHDCLMPDVLRFLANPQHVRAKKPKATPRTVMWVATCAQERLVGNALCAALRPHGVEVIVEDVAAATGVAVAQTFRRLWQQRKKASEPVPSFVGGIGSGGLATATAPIGRKKDGLAGRIVVSTPLGAQGLRAFDRKPADVDFSYLPKAGLLSLFGDKDPKAQRQEAMSYTWGLVRKGHDANPVELANTSAEDALLGLKADDDLVVPLLLAFLNS